ncbi:DNA adenine methylase [Candidatus Saccharibacteria bacterium]|nr:DNA adenine methylase [Candidatus Saccharibacteria bacterium]
MKYLAVLGRQPEISLAELEAITGFEWQSNVFRRASGGWQAEDERAAPVATGGGDAARERCLMPLEINRLGGTQKLAVELEQRPLEYLQSLPEGKITIGVSDYSKKASKKTAQQEALKLKKILVRHGRSVRVVENKDAVLSTATSLHNGLSGKNERKVELIKVDDDWYRVIGVQDIDAYAKRDQARPARDAKVGMLPPKLAQILINLCGSLKPDSVVLDPFCGTGVVLQEALLLGYRAYGTDINERMIEYSKKNLEWLKKFETIHSRAASGRPVATGGRRYPSACQPPDSLESNSFQISQGDATSYTWEQPINAVACEGYLGKPFSNIPTEMELKEQKQECKTIIIGFLKNLVGQIKSGTPVVIAAPAWLRSNELYERLEILDDIQDMGYNVNNKTREGLLYHRESQIVARDILILRKK